MTDMLLDEYEEDDDEVARPRDLVAVSGGELRFELDDQQLPTSVTGCEAWGRATGPAELGPSLRAAYRGALGAVLVDVLRRRDAARPSRREKVLAQLATSTLPELQHVALGGIGSVDSARGLYENEEGGPVVTVRADPWMVMDIVVQQSRDAELSGEQLCDEVMVCADRIRRARIGREPRLAPDPGGTLEQLETALVRHLGHLMTAERAR